MGFTLLDRDVERRSTWAAIAQWLVAASLELPVSAGGLHATHEWFWHGSGRPLGEVPDLTPAIDFEAGGVLRALLPYLLDPAAAATRRDVLSSRSSADERRARKASGVYYTPGDVADLMVSWVQSTRCRTDVDLWLDPAHGSGVFLRAIFSALGGLPEAADRIYGIDLDPLAAEAASFVLTAEALASVESNWAPWQLWHRFRRNLVTGDALLVGKSLLPKDDSAPSSVGRTPTDGCPLGRLAPWSLDSVFPETADRGFSCIVANPPYAPLQHTAATSNVPELRPITGSTARQDISPVFAELCAELLPSAGALAIVLPLSVVSSTKSPFPELRAYLARQPGLLELRSFDRVPDALFGDDIKTRNAIICMDKGRADELVTSPLYRWTSRSRQAALRDIPLVTLSSLEGAPKAIPKIGTAWERELLRACRKQLHYLEHWQIKRRVLPLERLSSAVGEDLWKGDSSNLLALAPTAYNFLGVLRDPYRALIDGHTSQNGFAILKFATERLASAAYALLCSRLTFWLWHVTGDGFHVTNALHRQLPAPLDCEGDVERLADLGDRLWKRALQRPIVSNNRGRKSVAYPAWPNAELIDEIDVQLGEFLGVSYSSRLTTWHEQLIVVDRDYERYNLTKRNE